jgi:hypothetical protein
MTYRYDDEEDTHKVFLAAVGAVVVILVFLIGLYIATGRG